MNARILVLIAALGLVAACSGRSEARPGEGALLSNVQTSPASGCLLWDVPEEIPVADSLVRSGLGEEVRTLARRHELGTAHAIFSLTYASDGTRLRRDLIEHSVPDSVVGPLRDTVLAGLRDLRPEEPERDAPEGWELLALGVEEDWGVRLRIDVNGPGDGSVGLQVGRQEYCPPRPRDPRIEESLEGVVAAGPRYRGGRRERVVIMEALIHPSGYMVSAEIVEGEARGSTLERRLRDHLRQFAFHPATLDGTPTFGRLQIPVRIHE